MEQTPDKKNDNFQKDGKEQFNRSIGLISNFALGFTYLSTCRRLLPSIRCLHWP